MLHAAYLVCFVALLLAGLMSPDAHSAGASRALPVAVQCPAIRTPRGTLVSRYVQDHFPSGADACVALSSSESKDLELAHVVPFNFCPRGGRYTPRRNATDVCLIFTEPGSEQPVPGTSAAKG